MKIYFFLLFVALLVPQFVNALPGRSRNEPDCSQYEDGETLPDHGSCSKYYMCINGKALRKYCARGLYYDVMSGLCNRAFLVDCSLNRLGKEINDIVKDIPSFDLDVQLGFRDDARPEEEIELTKAATSAPCTTTACATTPTTCTTTTPTTTTCSTTTTTTTTCSTTTTCTTTTTKTTTCTTTTTKTTTCTTTKSTTCTTTTPTTTTCSTTTTTTTTCSTTTTCTTTTTTCSTTTTCTTTTTKTTTCTTTKSTNTTTCSTTTTCTTTTTTCSTKTTTTKTTTKTTTCTTTKSTTCTTTLSCTTTPSCTTTLSCTTTPSCTTTSAPCASTTTKKSIIGGKVEPLPYLSSTKDCQNLDDGTILLDFNHCRRYYTCSNRRVKRNRCSAGNWFDQETRTCRPRDSVTNCMAKRN